jgi:hypothetical protein
MIASVEGADIRHQPHQAFHNVAVAFDETRHQHLVGEPGVELGIGDAQFLRRTRGHDTAISHRNVRHHRPRRVHRDNLAGCEDNGAGSHAS